MEDLEEAERRLRLGDPQSAADLLRKTRSQAGLLLLGECLAAAGAPEEAARTWLTLPGHAGARLRVGRLWLGMGRAEAAAEQFRIGLALVRAEPERFERPDRLAHDLLIAWSQAAYGRGDAAQGDRLLGEAARAWPGSPRPLVALALRARDREGARRLLEAALARVAPARRREFLIREYAEAPDSPGRAVILDFLSG